MPQAHNIRVKYNEDELSATFTCPLCKTDWKFPFPARQVFGKPQPSPDVIVSLHLYGTGPEPIPCPEFYYLAFMPCAEAIDDRNVKLILEPVEFPE